tara:strand:- start:245 stop:433 length:189 start_codon:yes stop_codon:yes gene_type:complete
MKKNIQKLRTNKVRKAQLKLSKHKSMGTRSNFSIYEVASLMDVVQNRSQMKNESMLFSIHMN